jgi:hypothetical protein
MSLEDKSVIFSPSKRVLSEIEGDAPLSDVALGYLTQRAKNNFYDYVLTKFYEAETQHDLTKSALADRLGLGRDRISKLLASPGNWTIETVAELLAGICREELVPSSVPYTQRAIRNCTAADVLELGFDFDSANTDVVTSRAEAIVLPGFRMAAI